MATPIDHDQIEQLARAILGQLAPLTGTRGTGAILVANDTDDEIVLAKNSYLLPNVGALGELADDLVFKTRANPATLREHGQGGDWTIPPHDSLEVGIQSNVGGLRHNLPEGTPFRFDPPLEDLPGTFPLVASISDGAQQPDERPGLLAAVYYEELDSAKIAKDLASGRLKAPGAFICWMGSSPAEGRTATTNQGSTRANSGQRFFVESFSLFFVSSEVTSDSKRRSTGLRLLQAATRLLTDQVVTSDWELLTTLGSLEVVGRNRFVRAERHYVYQLQIRLTRTLTQIDTRTFIPWLVTHIVAKAPGREAPEPTGPITMADVEQDMPHS